MVSKALKITVVALIVFLVVYIVTTNSAPTAIYAGSGKTIQVNTGVVLIMSFALGALFAAIIATYFAVKAYVRERILVARDRRNKDFFRRVTQARGLIAIGDSVRSQAVWEDLIKNDPTNSMARVELAQALLAEGRGSEALRVLDDARSQDPYNYEVLKRAADVNLSLGNRTAALDNLALIVQQHPTVAMVSMARNLAEELHRPAEAMRYHEMLYSLGARGEEYDRVKDRIAFLELQADLSSADNETVRAKLKGFLKRHKGFAPALKYLADLERADGEINAAAMHLVEAAKASGDSHYWYEAAKLWLHNAMPESAISAARTATRESKGMERARTELDLIRLYVALGRLDEAMTHLEEFPKLMNEQGLDLSSEIAQDIMILKGLCFNRQGKHREAADLWKKLSKYEYTLPADRTPLISGAAQTAPAPRLSTP